MSQEIAGWRLTAASDRVVFFAGFGTWGADEARRFDGELSDAIAGIRGDWAFLGDATDWDLDDPAAQRIVWDANRRIASGGCRAACFYTGPGALNRLLLYRLSLPDDSGCRFRVYPDRARAVAILEEAGFPLTADQLSGFFRGDGASS